MKRAFLGLILFGLWSPVFCFGDDYAVSAQAAFSMVEERGDEIVFLDVRDPVEIMFIGATNLVDANIPFLLADRERWNPKSGTFLMERNPEFVRQVAEALQAKGLDRDAPIITMCRSGSSRGRPSAEFLRESGFPGALYIEHGFQGDRATEGAMAGRRVVNGWQNSDLPWDSKMNPGKIFRADSDVDREWLVILKSDSLETQAMAMVLATVEIAQGTPVRVLLCDTAGLLAVKEQSEGSEKVEPIGRSPRQMLLGLMEKGATVEVCGVFLPNRDIGADALIQGVGVAKPNSIARAISQPSTVTLTF